MTLDNAIYPRISLPTELKLQFLWNRIMQFATSLVDVDNNRIALEQEFKELISRQNALISKICFSYSGSIAEFDDLRQDTLINIWRGMHGFRGESSEKTWIYRITVNSCISTIKSLSRHQHDSLEGLYGLIECDGSDSEDFEHIHRLITSLNPQDKAIIMMWLDELTYDDIAANMGMNRNTIATKIRRIKDKITKQYNREEIL